MKSIKPSLKTTQTQTQIKSIIPNLNSNLKLKPKLDLDWYIISLKVWQPSDKSQCKRYH